MGVTTTLSDSKDRNMAATTSKAFAVGETVRAPLPDHAKARRRGVIATLQDDGVACLLWEDEAPQTISNSKFLVAPTFRKTSEEEVESTVAVSEMRALLDFEHIAENLAALLPDDKAEASDIERWKGFGDQLLRQGDGAAAVPYYEEALRLTSSLQVGASVLIQQGGNIELAEVDCVNEEDDTVDLTLPKSGEERIVPKKEIKLCVLEGDDQHLQERVLLNLARCLLQLAETSNSLTRRAAYLRSAYLACTLSLSVDSMRESTDDTVSSTVKTSLLLRSQAYAMLSKVPYAIADIKRLLTLDPQHKEGKRRLGELERHKIELAKTDKKLAKDMCKWVQAATNESSVSAPNELSEEQTEPQAKDDAPSKMTLAVSPLSTFRWILMAAVFAWMVRKSFF